MLFYLLIKVYWDKIINELIGLWFIQLSRSSIIITVPFFAIAFLLLGMHQSSPTEYQSDWSPSRTGYLRRTGIQSNWVTSHDWNWCIPTSRVFEMRIFLSSNFKKMRKYRFYWWSYFVYLFMIEVLNDFGLLKRIYVFWSKGDPVGTGYQSDRLPNRTGYPVGLDTQSGLGTSPTGYPVRLGDRSDWYPVTQSGTGTGASLA